MSSGTSVAIVVVVIEASDARIAATGRARASKYWRSHESAALTSARKAD